MSLGYRWIMAVVAIWPRAPHDWWHRAQSRQGWLLQNPLFLLAHGASLFWDPLAAVIKAAWAQLCGEKSEPDKGLWRCLGTEAWPFVCEAMERKSNGFLMEGTGNCLEAFVPSDTNCVDQYITRTFYRPFFKDLQLREKEALCFVHST